VGAAWEQVRCQLQELGVSHVHRFEGRQRIPVELSAEE
jgi:hypothetical protein